MKGYRIQKIKPCGRCFWKQHTTTGDRCYHGFKTGTIPPEVDPDGICKNYEHFSKEIFDSFVRCDMCHQIVTKDSAYHETEEHIGAQWNFCPTCQGERIVNAQKGLLELMRKTA
jgi:hypothetical protein